VPAEWKLVNVSPIFKNGNTHKAENYRPVSLMCQMSKIFETIVRDALVQYLESHKLIMESQHGFRNGRSCLTNILTFLDEVVECVDSGEEMDVIYMDFAKAFDKVPQRLCRKLESHGISGQLLSWISEWLVDRTQRVCISGVMSRWLFMVALCNRADHYIFMLWFVLLLLSFFLFFSSPNLSSRRLDVYHTLAHNVVLL